MAKQIIWSLRAINDRKEILQYWKLHNQSTAYSKKLNALFRKAVSLIANHPGIGRKSDFENVRVKLVRDYRYFMKKLKANIDLNHLGQQKKS